VLVSRQERGRGVVYSIGLPVSVEVSDLSLRPGFLSLLDHLVAEALRRRGPRSSEAGSEWWFPGSGNLQVTLGGGPPLALREADGQRVATPDVTGRYEIALNGTRETRFITLPAEEVLATPTRDLPAAFRDSKAGGSARVDASPELGWVLLALLAIEMAVRLARLLRERRGQSAIQPSSS
jgi:hypothetical protein